MILQFCKGKRKLSSDGIEGFSKLRGCGIAEGCLPFVESFSPTVFFCLDSCHLPFRKPIARSRLPCDCNSGSDSNRKVRRKHPLVAAEATSGLVDDDVRKRTKQHPKHQRK